MVLTSTNIVHYLLERGLVTPESVVDGDFMVVETPRRNRNFKIIRTRHPGYFVKQVQKWDTMSITTLRCEAHCYWLTTNHADFAPLAALMPRYHSFDNTRSVLVTELLAEGENLSEYHSRQGTFPTDVASQLGQAFGQYHRRVLARLYDASLNSVFARRVPWVLSIHQTNPYFLQQASPGNHQLVGLIQKYPQFSQWLDALRSEWQTTSLIHGDIKWDNCVVYPNGDRNGGPSLKIIDWELADWGDPCWDVAAIFNQYIAFWISSLPLHTGEAPQRLVELTRYPIERMQPAIKAFWKNYAAAMQLDGAASRMWLERSMRYCGARMIQTAYEYLQYSQQISQPTLFLLQASMNILSNPQEAIHELLGM